MTATGAKGPQSRPVAASPWWVTEMWRPSPQVVIATASTNGWSHPAEVLSRPGIERAGDAIQVECLRIATSEVVIAQTYREFGG